MKKIVALLVTAMVIFVFAGCPQTTDGGGGNGDGGEVGSGAVFPIPNGDFSKGQVPDDDPNNAGAGIDWVYHIEWGKDYGTGWVDQWGNFSVNDDENKQFVAGTAASQTDMIVPAFIEQTVENLGSGTYTAQLQISSSWVVADGDTVKIEILNATTNAVIGTSPATKLNTWVSGGDWVVVETPEFTLATATDVKVKITFDIKTPSAGATIDDVTLLKI